MWTLVGRRLPFILLVLVAAQCSDNGPTGYDSNSTAVPPAGLQVGRPVPRVQGVAADGVAVDSRQWKGRVNVLFFWALYCSTCLGGDLPALQSMQESFGTDRLNIVTVNPIDDRGELREVQATYRYSYPFVADEDRSLWRRFGGMELPSVVVVDADGIVRYHAGGFDAFATADVVSGLLR